MKTGLYRLKKVDCFYTLAREGQTYRIIGDITTDQVDVRSHDVVLVVDNTYISCKTVDAVTGKVVSPGFETPVVLWGRWFLAIDPSYLSPTKDQENADSC